jgi:hypothetical protein
VSNGIGDRLYAAAPNALASTKVYELLKILTIEE